MRGNRGPEAPAWLGDFSATKQPSRVRVQHCRHVLRSPSLPLPAHGQCPHGTCGDCGLTSHAGGCLIKVHWQLLAQVQLLPVETTLVFQRQAMVMSKAKLRTEAF